MMKGFDLPQQKGFEMISVVALLMLSLLASSTVAFTVSTRRTSAPTSASPSSSTALFAIGVLAKKAKEADLRQYVQGGVDDAVMEQYKIIKSKIDSIDLSPSDDETPGPLQQALTRRKGTLSIIAEYKRKTSSGRIHDVFDPELMSPVFREYGAAAVAVMADERMGGCNYDDLQFFHTEQQRAWNEVPGPIMTINNDLIIDEVQVARSKVCGASACVLNYEILVNEESEDSISELVGLLKACKAIELEAIVAVSTAEQAQAAVDAGARILSVIHVDGPDAKTAVIANLSIPENVQVCTIANILARNDNQLQEIEEAWAVRDNGFNCAWIGEALYKSGQDAVESPGNILKAMKSKSSLKWASAKAYSGRGEGAKEYLGDILM